MPNKWVGGCGWGGGGGHLLILRIPPPPMELIKTQSPPRIFTFFPKTDRKLIFLNLFVKLILVTSVIVIAY